MKILTGTAVYREYHTIRLGQQMTMDLRMDTERSVVETAAELIAKPLSEEDGRKRECFRSKREGIFIKFNREPDRDLCRMAALNDNAL